VILNITAIAPEIRTSNNSAISIVFPLIPHMIFRFVDIPIARFNSTEVVNKLHYEYFIF